MQKHIARKRPVSKRAAKLVNAPLNAAKPRPRFKHEQPPDKLTYALAAYTAERRKDGWYVAKTVPSFNGEKPKWKGPFETIESACLCMGRHLSVELADRHTRSIETRKIDRKHPLYGLKPTTRLRAR
jgi:hypothetical protein